MAREHQQGSQNTHNFEGSLTIWIKKTDLYFRSKENAPSGVSDRKLRRRSKSASNLLNPLSAVKSTIGSRFGNVFRTPQPAKKGSRIPKRKFSVIVTSSTTVQTDSVLEPVKQSKVYSHLP